MCSLTIERLPWFLLCLNCALVANILPEVTIREYVITSKVVFRYANVVVKSHVVNSRSYDQEVIFEVKLPKEAFITSFLYETNNKISKAVIKEKAVAEIYYRRKKSNARTGQITYYDIIDDVDIDVFKVSVNVAANSEIKFRLEYEELLHKHAGKHVQRLFVDSGQLIEKLELRCELKDKQKFKMLTYKTPFYTERVHVVYNKGNLDKDGFYYNEIEWKPSTREQENANRKLGLPFEIEYELEDNKNGGILIENELGQFVHMFSAPCEERKIMMKQIVFVIDISGSMDGNPIEQVKEAMDTILSRLRSHDFFNIILFDDDAIMWKSTFQQATSLNVFAAKVFIQRSVKADGRTNINEALQLAVDMFDKELPSRVSGNLGKIIVFLTDGSPTYGEMDTKAIRRNVRARNFLHGNICCKSSINTIAFGRYADMDFLRIIAYEHGGLLTVVKETESNVAGELVKIYKDIENPFYKNLEFTYSVSNILIPEENVSQIKFLQYDCGSELIVSGWTHPHVSVYPKVKAESIQNDIEFDSVPIVTVSQENSRILSRLVAYKRIKRLLKEAESTFYPNTSKVLNKMALGLSLENDFVTNLTTLFFKDYSTVSGDVNVGYSRDCSFRATMSNICAFIGLSLQLFSLRYVTLV
ncbi:inter-alpha-trypsin inhibitor heavy chain H3-like [Ruditapes philippinarum]|uniref:inter-alpha-trypsin inhibitor heavy chain H3-like n=1 Tax=Ruditapes philippinarum TaxID=129788 RepID=UPI00295ACE7B|nr:inter-alpha-trypsin inhibitor heavy chain H3-like [Ruditapes philippinarum]